MKSQRRHCRVTIAYACIAALMMASLALATGVNQSPDRNPNQIIQKTLTTPDGSRYYCEYGSSTVELLDDNYHVVSRVSLTDEAGSPVSVAGLRYDETLGQLVALTSEQLYAVNVTTGQLTAIATPNHQNRALEYDKIELRQAARAEREARTPRNQQVNPANPESVRAHDLYLRWLETGAATAEEKALMEQYVFPRFEHSDRGALDEFGGPDAGDYFYTDSGEPGGPTFNWIELCGDPLANDGPTGDDVGALISWTNNFNFYGTDYTSAFIQSNGRITFVNTDVTFTNTCDFPGQEPVNGNPFIAPFWDDLVTSVTGCPEGVGLRWRDFGDMVVVEWFNLARFGDNNTQVTFEAILFPATGEIVFQYQTMEGGSASIGIDAPGADLGLNYGVCNSTLPAAGTAIRFFRALLPPPLLCDCPFVDGSHFESGALDIAILDDQGDDYCSGAGQIVHTLTVPGGAGTVQDINVIVHMTHTFYPDLVMDITHNGTTVLLTSQGGGGIDCGEQTWIFDDSGVPWVSADCEYNGCVQPGSWPPHSCATTTDLNAFNGMDASGDWTFRLVDAVGQDEGILFEWGLCFALEPIVLGFVQVDFDFPDFHCVDGLLSPTEFDVPVHVTNPGPGDCFNVEFGLGDGVGPAGTMDIEPNNHNFGTLLAGESADFNYHCIITPSGSPGNIVTSGFVSSSCGAYFIDFITINIPACLAPGVCGCMDVQLVVDITGSMGSAIDNVRSELPNILAAASNATGGDVRFGLITFDDLVNVQTGLTFDQDHVSTLINGLFASGGGGEPEASDEALRHALLGFNECDADDATVFDPWRDGCQKVVVLITDARPGGCDDIYIPGVDDVNAHNRALDAQGLGARIAAVYVPTFADYSAEIVPIMLDYANTSSGSYVQTSPDGSGTGAGVATILENCGGGIFPDDCLPEGPDCNGGQPTVYTTVSGMVDDAVLQVNPEGQLVLNWDLVDGAEFYQVYTSSEFDEEYNWTPLAFSLTNSVQLPPMSNSTGALFHVKGQYASQCIIPSDIACWPFDEGAGDWTEDFALDNDGTIVGAEWVVGPSGHPCLHFGYGDYVAVPNSADFYGQPLQVDACVSIENYPTVQTGAYYIFACHRYATWFEGFGLRIDVGGRLQCLVWDEDINNWRTLTAPWNRPVPLGEPFHVTSVINGNQSMLILNNEVVAAGNQPYNSITNGFSMAIGAHHYNDNGNGPRYQYFMRGDIHWLKIAQFSNER